jgi:hypothetical protein
MRIGRTLSALAATVTLAVTSSVAGSAAAAPPRTCAWRLVKAPISPGNEGLEITAVNALSKDDVRFAGTVFTGFGLAPWTLRWNGSAVTQTEVPQIREQNMLLKAASFASGDEGWILGQGLYGLVFPAEHWHGDRWTLTPTAASPDPKTIGVFPLGVATLSATDAWSAGMFYRADKDVTAGLDPVGALTEHWDGTAWRQVPNPAGSRHDAYLVGIGAVSPSDVWAVGRQPDDAGKIVPLVEHWDGHAWSVVPVPTGNKESALYAVSTSGRDVWAAGVQTREGTSNLAVPLIEHWDGRSWKVADIPDVGNSRAIAVYAAAPNDVWAPLEDPTGVNEFLHWDGRSWTTVPVPGPRGAGLTYLYQGIGGTGPGDVWAAGTVTDAYQTVRPQIAHWTCGGR